MPRNQSRRDFLSTASIVTANALLGSQLRFSFAAGDDRPDRLKIKKSLKWNMVKLEGTTLEKFRVLKEIGYDGVELDGSKSMDPKEAVAARDAVDLPIEGIVNPTHWQVRHSDPNPETRQQALEKMLSVMRFAKAVEAESVLLVPGKVTDPETENHDQVWHRSIDAIKQMIPLAERLDVSILIESVGNGFCENPEVFTQYIDEINHPLVQIHFDIGNHIRLSPPAQWIRTLAHRIKKLDVKDRTKTNERQLIGEGDADWPEVRKALVDIGFTTGWAAAEVPGGDRERLADIYQRMNSVLGKLS